MYTKCSSTSLKPAAKLSSKAAGKKWNNYFKIDGTKDFLRALESNALIRAIELVKANTGHTGGTWIHRLVAVHFGAQVSLCVSELMIIGKVEILNELRAIDWVMFIEIHRGMNMWSVPTIHRILLFDKYIFQNEWNYDLKRSRV